MPDSLRYSKSERLYLKKDINKLFDEGKSFIAFPLRIVYLSNRSQNVGRVSVLMSVPKKRFKRAVKRNRIKRLIKESYRLSKVDFIQTCCKNGLSMYVAFMFISDGMPKYYDIDQAVKKSLNILINKAE